MIPKVASNNYIAFQSFHILKNFLWEHVSTPPPPLVYDPTLYTLYHSCLMKVEQTRTSSPIENPVYMSFGTFLAQRHQTSIKKLYNYKITFKIIVFLPPGRCCNLLDGNTMTGWKP